MKGITESEIQLILEHLEPYVGFELTNARFDEKALQLSFSNDQNYCWLTISLKPGSPFVFVSGKDTKLIKGLKKPLATFIKTHLVGEVFKGFEMVKEEGRVFRLQFENEKSIKARLFPGGQNIEVGAHKKTLWAFKPKELNPRSGEPAYVSEAEPRPNDFFYDHWQATKGQKASAPKKSDSQKAIQKKERGLKKMEESLQDLKNSHWKELGAWLKAEGRMNEIPAKWTSFVDTEKSLAWNIENAFQQMKKQKGKIAGTLERIKMLQEEIAALREGKGNKKAAPANPSLMKASEAKGRTKKLSNQASFYIGKSAKDNLSLLRKARPWFLWFHLRDYPGAHGILETQRKSPFPELKLLQEAATELIRESVRGDQTGRFDVLIAECRFVRPIKGAKSGQVTYSHEKVIQVDL